MAEQPVPQITGAPIDFPPPESPPEPQQKVAPTDPEARAALAAEAPKPAAKDGYQSVTFLELSDFPYATDEDGALLPDAVLPQEIADLDGQLVGVSGFLIPIDFQEDKVSSLILVRNQLLCCFGEEPQLNEWIFVNINPPVEPVTEKPITLYGKFYASPDEEAGQTISLYRMDATEMTDMEI